MMVIDTEKSGLKTRPLSSTVAEIFVPVEMENDIVST